jgi:hypothetical protein
MTSAQVALALGAQAGVPVNREHAPPGWLSVTQALKLLGFSNYDGIPPQILERAARRGTAVHLLTALEEDGEHEEVHRQLAALDGDIDPAGQLAAYLRFRADTGWPCVGVEVEVRSERLQLLGHPDRLFVIPGRGLGILDVKPAELAAGPLDCVRLQTAGYALLVAEALGLTAKEAAKMARYALCLRGDGSYRLLPEFTDAQDIVHFQYVVHLALRMMRRQ